MEKELAEQASEYGFSDSYEYGIAVDQLQMINTATTRMQENKSFKIQLEQIKNALKEMQNG